MNMTLIVLLQWDEEKQCLVTEATRDVAASHPSRFGPHTEKRSYSYDAQHQTLLTRSGDRDVVLFAIRPHAASPVVPLRIAKTPLVQPSIKNSFANKKGKFKVPSEEAGVKADESAEPEVIHRLTIAPPVATDAIKLTWQYALVPSAESASPLLLHMDNLNGVKRLRHYHLVMSNVRPMGGVLTERVDARPASHHLPLAYDTLQTTYLFVPLPLPTGRSPFSFGRCQIEADMA